MIRTVTRNMTRSIDRHSPPATSRVLGACVVAVCALLASCSNDDEGAARNDDGRITRGGSLSVFELRAGDCLDPAPDVSGDIDKIAVAPCAEPHTQEVFAIVEASEQPYPGPEGLATTANALCISAMQDDLGLSPDDGYYLSYLLPSFNGWNNDDDRSIVCVFVFPTLGEVTGSVIDAVDAGTVEPGTPPPVVQVTTTVPVTDGSGS